MKVLGDWDEVGTATISLQQRDLPLHKDFQKNWDLWQILQLMEPLRERPIVDLGSGENYTLNMLRRAGFKALVGIDMRVPRESWFDGLRSTYRRYRPRKGLLPRYRLVQGNILNTPFDQSFFDAAVCLSVVEHNVNLEQFFAESSRILRKGARMYLSTDYWEPKINTTGATFGGMPWKIFDKTGVETLAAIGRSHGFKLDDPTIPDVKMPVVYAKGKHYTFISMTFTLSKST